MEKTLVSETSDTEDSHAPEALETVTIGAKTAELFTTLKVRDWLAQDIEGNEIVGAAKEVKVFSLRVDDTEFDALPDGYFYMGGTDRNVLLKALGYKPAFAPRDNDLVGIDEFHPHEEDAKALSEKYMPTDYSFGHGVEIVPMSKYFATRDFGVNEVLVAGGTLYFSENALTDLQERMVRLTDYEASRSVFRDKLAIKSLRMLTELNLAAKNTDSSNFEVDELISHYLSTRNVSIRSVALGFDRALTRGNRFLAEFYSQFLKRCYQQELPKAVSSSEQLKAIAAKEHLRNIAWKLEKMGSNFVFEAEVGLKTSDEDFNWLFNQQDLTPEEIRTYQDELAKYVPEEDLENYKTTIREKKSRRLIRNS